MRIDRTRLKEDIRALEIQIRAMKHIIRTAPLPWPENYARALRTLKASATLCYAIAAQARGRLHLRRVVRSHAHLGIPPLEVFEAADQARFIGDRWQAYAAPEGEARCVG